MVDYYESMISDFIDVSELIENYTKNKIEHWDTNLTTLEFYTAQKTQKYNCKEAAKILRTNECQVQNFFVVHCCLSNYLNDLIGKREYTTWFVKDGNLNISYPNGATERYGIHDIAWLMKKTEKVNWSYEALVESWKKITASRHK